VRCKKQQFRVCSKKWLENVPGICSAVDAFFLALFFPILQVVFVLVLHLLVDVLFI